MIHKVFDKNIKGIGMKNNSKPNDQLPNELNHKILKT